MFTAQLFPSRSGGIGAKATASARPPAASGGAGSRSRGARLDGVVDPAANADTPRADPVDADSEAAFPPRANGVWMYDRDPAGKFDPGRWINLINKHNAAATPGNELDQVFSYDSDMETYCEDDDSTKCTIDDLNMYYTPDSDGYESTCAYVDGLDPIGPDSLGGASRPVIMTPVIDGRIGPEGYLGTFAKFNGWLFNNLTYVASPRSTWKDNKLAYDNSWTAADGRKWRTESKRRRPVATAAAVGRRQR